MLRKRNQFAKPKVDAPPSKRWHKKEYKSPVVMWGPTKWITTTIERNGKELQVNALVPDVD